MEIKKLKLWKRVLSILVIVVLVSIIGFIFYKFAMYLDMERRFKKFESGETLKTVGTLLYAKDDNIATVENMDFINQDKISVKVDSISINDHTFSANVSFKFDEEFDYQKLSYAFAVYDDENNIYEIFTRMHMGETEKYDYNSIFMQRELGINQNKDIYSQYLADRAGIGNVSKNGDVITTTINIEAKEKFPKSKKIFIKIFDLGYYTINKEENEQIMAQNYNLSDAKWQFEFDIPEEMNNRETVNLKLDNDIPGLKIVNATLTDTNLVINFESEDYMSLISEGKDMPAGEFQKKYVEMLNITDGEGNVYQDLGGGTTSSNGYKIMFNVTKKDLSKKLFINFKIGDVQYKSELLEK